MRFAILCRVSSEDQLSGQSLDVQRKTLRQCVQSLDGEIVKEYVGQESATKSDRPILDSLLADCSSGLFEAVMIYDSSRLDRDPVRAKISFATFKKYGIKLYIQHSQYDLNNPEASFIASLMSEVSQFQVAIQTKKAMESRIELARRGYPLGQGPHGRLQVETDKNKPARYEIIPEAQQEAETFWEHYIKEGLELQKIANLFNTSMNYVRKVLFEFSGATWKQKVKFENRNEIIITSVPPLLTDQQIAQAKELASRNKKFNSRKYLYLLGGKVKCGLCENTYTGQTSFNPPRPKRHYVHSYHFRTELCIKTIRVELVETSVFYAINHLFSSLDNLKECIQDALSTNKKQEADTEQKIITEKNKLKQLEKEKDKAISLSIKGILTEQEISKEIIRIRKETLETETTLSSLEKQLTILRTDVPDNLASRINHFYHQLVGETDFEEWDHNTKQVLVDWFLGNSKENGVFILKDPLNGVVINIRGIFNSSYLGVINPSINHTEILGFQEINTKKLTSSVDFTRILETLTSLDENTSNKFSLGIIGSA